MEKVLHLLPKEAAERLRVSAGTLANWRVEGGGPRYIKLGRKVVYPIAELEAFELPRLRSNTAEVGCVSGGMRGGGGVTTAASLL
jgi:hypothetical protein